jgi:hypothetical protein
LKYIVLRKGERQRERREREREREREKECITGWDHFGK